jgi:DNA polymerase
VTKYQLHVERYRNCQGCELCRTRDTVVFPRGSVPADVVFVGEAPGESENVRGRPFDGPAGQLLDRIIDRAGLNDGKFRYALTNLVLCIPYAPDGVGKVEEPDRDHVVACKGRLEEFLRICRPRLVVAVGKCAHDWLVRGYKGNVELPDGAALLHVTHPATILRQPDVQRDLAVRRCVVQLRQALEQLQGKDGPGARTEA